MKTLLLANNRTALEAVPLVREAGLEIAGLVVHPPERGKFREEIIAAASVPEGRLFSGEMLGSRETLARIESLGCELALSVSFGYILRGAFLRQFPRGVLNLHPSLLPWGRGACPNVWAIMERHPAGATLHYVDEGIDSGDIIAQQEVRVRPWDTGATLYEKLHQAALDVLRTALPDVVAGRADRRPQTAAGPAHRLRDLEAIDEIDLEKTYTARELIDLLRARTFPPYDGAYFRDESGRKVFLRLQLHPEGGRVSVER